MNITELDQFSLADTVKFHDRLNPRLWGRDEHLLPEVQQRLMAIADDFREFLGVTDLDVEDITVSGSNAAYSYTPQSDIDLHLVVRLPQANADVLRELFAAKKYQYNDEHDIRIGGADVELYVQPSDEPHISQGIYSVKNQDWIQVPRRRQPDLDDTCVAHKVEDLQQRIGAAVERGDEDAMQRLWSKIKTMRQTGLEQQGEFGCDNLAFKTLRRTGDLERLKKALTQAHDERLSLAERRRRKKRTRYAYGGYWAPGFAFGTDSGEGGGDGGGESVVREAKSDREILGQFMRYVIDRLNIDPVPRIVLHKNDQWSQQNHSFGRYDPDTATLHVSLANRHIMDVMRTAAHELVHSRQHQTTDMPATAGDTGSPWENQAHAEAGVIMRDFADANPEMFDHNALQENASGYIPTRKQARDPRYAMALTVDVRPGEVGRQANKMALKTDSQGRPALVYRSVNQLAESVSQQLNRELELLEDEIIGEIKMSPTNLRQEAARTGARAGMEFEMIVPNVEGEEPEPEYEPDYDYDRRARSLDDIEEFFNDGDYNGRGDIRRLRDALDESYQEWKMEQVDNDWASDGLDYLRDYISDNDLFDRDGAIDQATEEFAEANPDIDVGSDEAQQGIMARVAELEEQFVEDEMRSESRIYNEAYHQFIDEQEYDEADFLRDNYPYMTDIESNYSIQWPYYTDINAGSGGEQDIESVADDFGEAIGRPVNWSRNYHGGRREPGTYVVEPDGSLDADNPGDSGLEFVSPPLPIDELISDLNKVKDWAGRTGCYTNSSTGLHINISVPDYSLDKLDYVKLALLMGDEYVLEQFGRASNHYAKAAMGKIRDRLRLDPDLAPQIMDKMRGHMEDFATKAIHSGQTDKYTSINTKTGYIEFRSPGGDWLDANFDKIENTLLRFTVALSAATNPDAYRQEYLKKLYKLLEGSRQSSGLDVLQLFANYSAGELDKAALIRQVREKQLARNLAKGRTPPGQKFWWNVSRPGYFASIEVIASSKEEAIAKALEPGNYPDWASARNTLQAKPLRPYQEPQAPNQTGNWGIWMQSANRFARAPGQIDNSMLRRFPSREAAEQWIAQTRSTNSALRTDIEVREIEPAGRPQQPLGGQNFPRTPQTPPAPASGGTFTGTWLVLDPEGREMHRFSGVGNVQSDANRVAMDWLRQRPGRMQAGVTVVPEMN